MDSWLLVRLITITLVVLFSFFNLVNGDCEWEWECRPAGCGYYEDCDNDNDNDDDLPTGWIVAGVVVGIILFIGIPILTCFCCAWACFSGRKSKANSKVVYAVPPNHQIQGTGPPQQMQYYQNQPSAPWVMENQHYGVNVKVEPPPPYPHELELESSSSFK